MDFLSATAQQFRIPRPVVKDATTTLLLLLQRFGKPDEVARLVRELPVATQLLGTPKNKARKSAIVSWVTELVAVVANGTRSIKESLKATGLREAEIVPFVSTFVRHAAAGTDRQFTEALINRVPGLIRLAAWSDTNTAGL